ncbi:hypothetical protein Glove_461g4 [Diversispora epigaea]|uniref:Uncharacterized protein n=1 Tax=Diversispora epigaea TaxID=1348612 RepID=A0A397GN00_9GLOM|nr:hypothetical protein Glove_461g4 [Diversispora epigaea]
MQNDFRDFESARSKNDKITRDDHNYIPKLVLVKKLFQISNIKRLNKAWVTVFSPTSSVSGFGSFTHDETNPFDTIPRIWKYGKYFDGTVVIRIVNRNPNKSSSPSEFWTRPELSLRIIHPNGTASEIDKGLEIPEFNWRIITSLDGAFLDPVNIYALQKGYLLATYFNASNLDDFTTYEEWGRIIDWNGNLYSEVFFGKAYIVDGMWYPSATAIVTNVDPKKGFIRISGMNITYIEWQQYTIDDSFNLKILSEGNITLQKNGTSVFNTIATVDEGYSIIIGVSTNSTNSSNNNPLEIRAAVYSVTKRYDDKQFGAPKMLYQLNLDNITITSIATGISSTGIGQVCLLTIAQNNVDYYVKLNFLSSGSITEIIPLDINVPELPSNSITGWSIESIPYGGYVFYGYFFNETQINVLVYYFNEITNNFTIWDYGSEIVNVFGILIILPNNTILVSQPSQNNSWSFSTTDIPKFTDLENDYSNFQVKSTSPSINANISTSTKNITITYHEPVELSYGNISIYQIDNSGNNIIREFFKGVNSFCSISDDELTVTVNVIQSTFSNPNSQFYVKVDNNFVRSKAYRESIMGINDNIWKFNTSSIDETFAETVSGVLRLTAEGTEYYEKNLNSTGKANFFSVLKTELSEIIPVNITRLSSNGKTQIDTTVSHSRQILISLNIESSKEERSVTYIVDDLNDMIIYKNMTSIGLFPTTKYLDEDFGFKPKRSIDETFAETVSGVLRLTAEGTEYYEKNLNSTGKANFFSVLKTELSEIIPVNITRLSSNGKTQIDTTVSHSRQILISLNIESSKEERSVTYIVDDLNDMIIYKNMTSIGLFPTTKYLDEDFGFKPKQNLWDKYKWKFLCVILVLAILVILFLIAKKMESKGRNLAILQLGLIVFDFIMDVLFVSKNGKVIEVLYVPSVIFLAFPIGINTIWAFYIISDENKSKPFFDWFTQHEKIASVFTVLSSADIDTLSILHSNLAGFKFFQAPISIKGKNRIFWASCLTIFVEDIPQLIIQLLYHISVVTYDIIPLLTLVSSCLSLLINIIGRLFQAINNCRPGTLEYDSTQNQEDFDGFRQLQTPATERNSTSDKSISHSTDVKEEEKNCEKNGLTKRSSNSSFQEVIH